MTNRNELERLLAVATPGPWTGYSEPEVNLPYSLFAGKVMETGFTPLEPLSAHDIDLICFLRNNTQHYLSLMDEVERLREALSTAEAAHAAYLDVKRQIHEGCTI